MPRCVITVLATKAHAYQSTLVPCAVHMPTFEVLEDESPKEGRVRDLAATAIGEQLSQDGSAPNARGSSRAALRTALVGSAATDTANERSCLGLHWFQWILSRGLGQR